MCLFVCISLKWVEEMASSGINHYTFHIEATDDTMGCIRKIREAGMKVSVKQRQHFYFMSYLTVCCFYVLLHFISYYMCHF